MKKHGKLINTSIALALASLALSAPAQAGLLSDRWAKMPQWDEALAAAKKADKPIAILACIHDYGSTTSFQDQAINSFMGDRSLEAFVRVVNYTEDRENIVRQYRDHAGRAGNMIPDLYLVDPHTMRLIGFVDYQDFAQTPKVARNVQELMKWIDKSKKDVERADKSAANGQFKSALKAIDKIVSDDAKASKALEEHLGVDYDPARTASEKPSGSGGARQGGGGKDDGKKADDKAEKEPEKEYEPGPGTFIPGLGARKRDEYDKLVAKRVEAAKADFTAKNYAKARAGIQGLVMDAADLPSVADAKTLLDEITAAEKEAKGK